MVKDSMRASFILGQWRAYHIPLVYGNALSVFQPRVLANGIFIDWCDVMILAYIKAIICVIFYYVLRYKQTHHRTVTGRHIPTPRCRGACPGI